MSRLFIFIASLSLTACFVSTEKRNYRSIQGNPSGPAPTSQGSGNANGVTYLTVAPIIDAGCNGPGCHSSPTPAAGIPLDDYASAVQYFDASVASVQAGRMPIGREKPTAEELQLLADWKAAGFPENESGGGGSASFSVQIAPIMQESCLGAGCHNTANPAVGIALETKDEVMTNFDASLATIQGGTMPIGRPALSNEAIKQLQDWKAAGFPD